MAAVNDFLPFASNAAANVITQAEYQALAAQSTGFQTGIAISAQLNKVWRQASIISATLAQLVADATGQNVQDDGTIATIESNLARAIRGDLGRGTDNGIADAYATTLSPAPLALTAGLTVFVDAIVADNTGASTFNLNAFGALPIESSGGLPLVGGEIIAGYGIFLRLNNTLSAWELLQTSGGFLPILTTKLGANGSSRTIQAKLKKYVDVLDFGADPTGVADSTTAIQNGATYLGALGGGRLILPPGVYHYTSLSIPAGVDLEGSGSYCTVLMCTTTVGDTIVLNGDNEARWIQFNSTAVRTGGRTIWAQGNNCRVIDFEAYNYFVFFDAQTAAGGQVIFPHLVGVNASTTSTTAGAAFALFTNYGNALVEKCVVTGPNAGTQPSYGVRLINGDTCILANNNITHHGCGLKLDPGAGQNVYATKSSNCLYDSASGSSNMEATSAGNVYDTTFTGDWFGLAAAGNEGALINPTGNVGGVTFTGCQFANNADSGLRVNGSTVLDVNVIGGYASGGTYGYNFSGACTHFSVIGARAGNVGGRGPNSQYGIIVQAGASDFYRLCYNDLSGNTVGGLSDSGTGTNKTVTGNLT